MAYKTRQNEPKEGEGTAGETRPLYERLHCIGCHNPPDAKEADPRKLSQKGVAERFPRSKLAEYLRAPEAHYAWTRMPNFHLSAPEAKELEEWLFAAAPKPELKPLGHAGPPQPWSRRQVYFHRTGFVNCPVYRRENLACDASVTGPATSLCTR